ncbi:MAG TPA: hypothetical protein DC054_01740 [Blastocatellia bacterium]|nr:hypothetical protein [Blastocatellia bacterium]
MKLAIIFLILLVPVGAFTFGQGQKKSEPCADAQTQADMNTCWGKEYKAADATLNQVYGQLMRKLDEADKTQLKQVEAAWLKYRDANCEFVGDQYKGGSMRPMIVAICLADATRNRTVELRNQIKDRDQ